MNKTHQPTAVPVPRAHTQPPHPGGATDAAAPTPDRFRRWGWPVAAVIGVVAGLREFSDPDIWFHLVIGREIFLLGSLPANEFYVFPAQSEPGYFAAAGYGFLQYLLYRIAGLPGLAVVNAVTFVATLWLLACAATRAHPGLRWPAAMLAIAVVLWGLNPRFVFRPETMLYLALAGELLLLESWRHTRRARYLLALPLLSWGITLLHTTWIVLVLAWLAYFVQALLERSVHDASTRSASAPVLGLFLAGVLMSVLPLINPYGIEQLLILPRSFGAGGGALVEYLPIQRTEYLPHFLFLALAVATSWVATKRVRICDALMVGGFGVLALFAARNIALLAIACFLPIAGALGAAASRFGGRWLRSAAMALAAVSVFLAIRAEENWGYGVPAKAMPVAGARMIRDHLAGCNVFNFFHFGGYLAWELGRPFKVAVDGHFVRPSAADPLHDRFFRADADWREIAARFDVCAIVTPAVLQYSGALIPLVGVLENDPAWQLVSIEPAGLTFFRAGQAPNLVALDKREIWRQASTEATEVLRIYPDQPAARETLRLASERMRR